MAYRDEVAAFAERTNAAGGTYHRLDLGGGVVVEGEYDMDAYLPHYQLPADLTGRTALDVGTASGYFAFELERRGAEVTAMDLYTDAFFGEVRRALGSSASYRQQDIYGLTPAFGQFDLVVCGSLLLHLPDPLGAARALRAVCRGQAVVATYASNDPLIEGRPVLEFLGQKASDGDYYTYWRMTPDALVALLRVAGFARAEVVSRFQLEGRSGYSSPHVVVHAWV